jgi:hypothetical protein
MLRFELSVEKCPIRESSDFLKRLLSYSFNCTKRVTKQVVYLETTRFIQGSKGCVQDEIG